MVKQICIIHGGTAYRNDDDFRHSLEAFTPSYERLLYNPDWKSWLPGELPDYDILMPSMPNKQNAKYEDWALYFSKIVPFLNSESILIGHSLGGVFLAKYLSTHPPTDMFKKIILIATPYADESTESLGEFKLSSASGLAAAAKEVHLLYSRDDPIVAFSESLAYKQDLPAAYMHYFEDKQHFNMAAFPELLELIRH